jgi:hypothetical protein
MKDDKDTDIVILLCKCRNLDAGLHIQTSLQMLFVTKKIPRI